MGLYNASIVAVYDHSIAPDKFLNVLDSVVKLSSSLCAFREKTNLDSSQISYFYISIIMVNRSILYVLFLIKPLFCLGPCKAVRPNTEWIALVKKLKSG